MEIFFSATARSPPRRAGPSRSASSCSYTAWVASAHGRFNYNRRDGSVWLQSKTAAGWQYLLDGSEGSSGGRQHSLEFLSFCGMLQPPCSMLTCRGSCPAHQASRSPPEHSNAGPAGAAPPVMHASPRNAAHLEASKLQPQLNVVRTLPRGQVVLPRPPQQHLLIRLALPLSSCCLVRRQLLRSRHEGKALLQGLPRRPCRWASILLRSQRQEVGAGQLHAMRLLLPLPCLLRRCRQPPPAEQRGISSAGGTARRMQLLAAGYASTPPLDAGAALQPLPARPEVAGGAVVLGMPVGLCAQVPARVAAQAEGHVAEAAGESSNCNQACLSKVDRTSVKVRTCSPCAEELPAR